MYALHQWSLELTKTGDPRQELEYKINLVKPDLVLVGNRGLNPFYRMLVQLFKSIAWFSFELLPTQFELSCNGCSYIINCLKNKEFAILPLLKLEN